jgi:putative transposase
MSRKGNPWDHAEWDSFMQTLKYEEVYRTEYLNLVHARRAIGEFLETVCNDKRLHSALDHRLPAQFESTLVPQAEGVERALAHVEHLTGHLLQPLRDAVPVNRGKGNRLKNARVQRAAQKIHFFVHG